jgi:hypothetical protein
MVAAKPKLSLGFARRITRSLIRSLVEDGAIDPRNKTEEQILAELAAMLSKIQILPVVDHTDAWLRKARDPKLAGGGFSIICYATWAEHMLNKMVSLLCKRRKVSASLCDSLIRHTRTSEKFVWLSLILTSRPPSKTQLNRLQRIAQTRNQYLHYKWKPVSWKSDPTLENLTRDAERLVTILRRFLNLHFYSGHRRRVQSLLRPRKAHRSNGSEPKGT